MRIEVHQYEQRGANGDRARSDTAYFSYNVILYGDHSVPVVLREWTGYDNYQSHILPDSRKEAEEYARLVSRAIDYCEFVGTFLYTRHVKTEVTWERVMS